LSCAVEAAGVVVAVVVPDGTGGLVATAAAAGVDLEGRRRRIHYS